MTAALKVAAANLPIVAAQWRRSELETIRVTLDHDCIDARCFFAGDEEEPLRPGRVGITLLLQHLRALCDGINAARREALARGLIDYGR
ncbi:hypothetical protein [Bradyrhizobium sp. URHD0069]|uniref:hypothetical protein n=1 Tax=Bradyrhizobium sp. URHD0069 TaxID=1380355 RepID=UPI00049663C1|nr:hypothetical protein [Bradyrhizobium sp. URHD0069]